MKRLLRHVSQLLPALLALVLLAFTLRSADLARSLALVQSLGWKIPFLLLPTFVATLSETFGWWLAFDVYVAVRAVALGTRFPALRRSVGAPVAAVG